MRCWDRYHRPLAALALSGLVLAGCSTSDPLKDAARHAVPTGPDGSTYRVLLRVADSTAESGDWSGAVELYRRAHKLDTTQVEALLGLGKSLGRLGAYDDAADAFKSALALKADSFEAAFGLGGALIGLDQPALARVHLEHALSLRQDARVHNALGFSHDMQRAHGKAQDDYRKGLALDAKSLSLHNNLGLSQIMNGELKQAIETLQAAVKLSGAGPVHRQNLALALALAGDFDGAARTSREDLEESAIKNNLAYYSALRELPNAADSIRALVLRQTVSASRSAPSPGRTPKAPLPR